MLGINFLFILRKSVNFSVILFSNRKMNSTTDNFDKDDDDNYDASWSTSEPSCSQHSASVLIIVLVSGSRLTLGNPSSTCRLMHVYTDTSVWR